MKLHLVGGFLGSGKTTAIIAASKLLVSQGLKVGVVTNDQGKYLVDTSFVRYSDVPAVEVTGGCFCCNFSDLNAGLRQLVETAQPDVVFAEAVGSCTDLVATVVKPLLALGLIEMTMVSFTVFTDARLLRRRLRGDPMPFSEDVVYIFDKQIEEANLVIVNKMDLLKEEKLTEVALLLGSKYPAKRALFQSSLTDRGISEWVKQIDSESGLIPHQSLDIDYVRYGNGEVQLAWLDENLTLRGSNLTRSVRKLLSSFVDGIREHGNAIGHIKFFIQDEASSRKISIPSQDPEDWEMPAPDIVGGEVSIVVNARVEMAAEQLRALFERCVTNCGAEYLEEDVRFFHPDQPKPQHRIA